MLKFIVGKIVQNVLTLIASGALFFILAGTISAQGFWIYVVTGLGDQLISLLIIVPKHLEYIILTEEEQF